MAVPGLRSTSSESVPGTRYYVRGANGDAIVNSRTSSAYLGLARVAGGSGAALALPLNSPCAGGSPGCRRSPTTD